MDKIIKGRPVPADPLDQLKEFTPARIAIGRVGSSIPIKETLELKLAHAHARDAVYSALDIHKILHGLEQFNLPVVTVHSKADNRAHYLQRPDLGRQLNKTAAEELKSHHGKYDIAIIIADGLSATAINEHIVGLLKILVPVLSDAKLKLAPFCLAEQSRVALGDDAAHLLGAKLSLVLIGERPGLSSADSIGAYLTYNPKPGLTDESRNCISNIRPKGLRYKPAAEKIFYLIQEALKRKLSGVALKDNQGLLGE